MSGVPNCVRYGCLAVAQCFYSLRHGWAAVLLCAALSATAEERITVCFNYGCLTQAEVVYDAAQLATLHSLFTGVQDAAQERAVLAPVIGRMLGWAGEQSPISADKGGNLADEAVYGKMDCIDHSTTTTRLLKLLDKQGLLRFHEVLEPVLRRRFLVFDHFSAQIREKSLPQDAALRFVVDSWFFDNGRPAAVMPLAQWQAGDDPNDDE